MNKAKRQLGLLAMLSFLISFQVNASHIMGGEITYKWISGNDYELTLVLYRDCSGIGVHPTEGIMIYSASCGHSSIDSIPLQSLEQVSPVCNGGQTTCNGGSYFGYEIATYIDTITLPFLCNDWQFIFGGCCRNGSINNIDLPDTQGAGFYATLDNLNVPFNNSPVFAANPVVLLSVGYTHQFNNGIYDPDGDSLVISLAPAMNGGNGSPSMNLPCTYVAPFTYDNPVTSTPPLTIDPATGTITVTPQVSEVDVIVYKVDEYRNGQLIGSTTRDIQVLIQAGSNQLPYLGGINGSGNYVINVCYTDTLQFTFTGFDPDLTDTLEIPWYEFTGADTINYTLNTSGINVLVNTFTFIPDITKISSQPYYLYVSVKDNACPYYGIQTFCYTIYVNSCSQDVWPGDANSDLQVDMYDLLPIGLAYNNTGPVRPGASLLWNAQTCVDWSGSFQSGVNHKHADCNGDGIVDLADTIGITTNFGLNHPAKQGPPPQLQATTADLYLVASPDTVLANNTIDIKVCLGTSAIPVDSIYGIAFRINYNPAPIDPASGSVSFAGSWMGTTGVDLLTFHRPNTVFGTADISMVRTDHVNTSGDSIIAIYSIVIVDNIAGKMGFPIWLTDAYAITYSESIISMNIISDTVTINTATGISNPLNDLVRIYPVPAGNYLQVDAGNEIIEKLTLSDVTGREIQSLENIALQRTRIDLTGLSEGSYFVTVNTSKGALNKRIIVIR